MGTREWEKEERRDKSGVVKDQRDEKFTAEKNERRWKRGKTDEYTGGMEWRGVLRGKRR